MEKQKKVMNKDGFITSIKYSCDAIGCDKKGNNLVIIGGFTSRFCDKHTDYVISQNLGAKLVPESYD
jgi:hypothetical protein